MIKVAFIEDHKIKISLGSILSDFKVNKKKLRQIKELSQANKNGYKIFIIACDITRLLSKEASRIIKEFVSEGGICWIIHQPKLNIDLSFLPNRLRNLRLENKYIDTLVEYEKEYVCPWILERNHSIWNKPNYIDEGAFAFWEVNIDGKEYRTSATHIIHQKEWNVIAGFADHEIKIKDKAAIIMESGYGKGLYFWTQVFSPQVVWDKENSFEKKNYQLFLENIFTYFKDYQENKLLRVRAEVKPWSVMAGERVNIKVKIDSGTNVKKISMEVLTPSGQRKIVGRPQGLPLRKKGNSYIKFQQKKNGAKKTWRFFYTPETGGNHQVKITVTAGNGAEAYAHAFFKVTRELTPYRFITHTHFQNEYNTGSLGLIFGQCKRIGIDAVVLSGGNFSADEGQYQNIVDEEIKLIDNPQVRFFPGEEIHPHHQYTRVEGVPTGNPDARRHVTTIGCYNLYPYSRDYWEPRLLKKIHKNGGIAICAHPYMDQWWMEPQDGHNFEAVEFDRADTRNWDKILKRGEFVVGVSGMDNVGSSWLLLRGPNTGYFDEPLALESLIKTILRGRVTKLTTYPYPFEAVNSEFWFDINNQIVGGTLYAVDKVNLHIKIKNPYPIQMIWVVKGSERGYIRMEPNIKVIDKTIEDKITEDTYYRLEVNPADKYYASYPVSSLTNPIFVKKVKGPGGAYFYLRNNASPVFDKKKGRWQPNFTQVKDVKFSKNIWEIELYEPGNKGALHIGWRKLKTVKIDNQKRQLEKSKTGETVVKFRKGVHKIVILYY